MICDIINVIKQLLYLLGEMSHGVALSEVLVSWLNLTQFRHSQIWT